MNLFLLGAGASRRTIATIPVAAEFGSALFAANPNWRTCLPVLSQVVDHLRLSPTNWPLEPVWSCIDYYAKLGPALPTKRWLVGGGPQIKKAILAVYGDRCDQLAATVTPTATLTQLLRDEIRPGDVLASFNYDTVAERVAAAVGCNLVCGSHAQLNDVRFLKPHGSASWCLDLATGDVTHHGPRGEPLLTSLTCKDVDRRREPLVLGAVPLKSELIREVQRDTLGVYSAVVNEWKQIVEALKDATKLVVVGYGFPVEDQYGRFMFGEGVRSRGCSIDVEFFQISAGVDGQIKALGETFRPFLGNVLHRGEVRPS